MPSGFPIPLMSLKYLCIYFAVVLAPVAAGSTWKTLGKNTGCGRETANGQAVDIGRKRHEGVTSVGTCRSLCAKQQRLGECAGFEFSSEQKLCTLFQNSVQHTRTSLGNECWITAGENGTVSTDVFVMLPLDTVSSDGTITDPTGLPKMLDQMKWAGVDGFMVDVWWGLTEKRPRKYDFSAYRELFEMARDRGWKVQTVASFHRCGGNVGDKCNIPLPEWLLSNDGIWYRDSLGEDDREYVSLFADDSVVMGRTPMTMYQDWMNAFASEFAGDLGSLISEVMVGMGPCGELRYPSYRLSHWQWCGVGEFQIYDDHAVTKLKAAATAADHPEWAVPPVSANISSYNMRPWESDFFTEGFKTDYGKFFLEWYSASLKEHGSRLLASARFVFPTSVIISGKVAGIHWWYDSESHAAEATAGYYNTNFRNAYDELAESFAVHGATLDFTCLEMRNTEMAKDCKSNPEGLVKQAIAASNNHGLPFTGENALPRYDSWAYDQVKSYRDDLAAFTYLRLDHVLVEEFNLKMFKDFVTDLHVGRIARDENTVTEQNKFSFRR